MNEFSWPARAAQLVPCFAQNAANVDVEGACPDQELAALNENGLLGASVPREFGGAGLGTDDGSTLALLQTLWHIGRGNLSVGRLFEGHVNALQLVSWFGSKSQKERLFADALSGHLFGVWNTQAGNGVSFGREQNGWKMSGSKTFCSGAPRVSRPVVTGELNGWQMAVVPMERVEVAFDSSWWRPLGMRASASFATDFSGAILGDEDLLGDANDYYAQPAFSGGAIRFCAVQLGGAASLFENVRAFLNETNRTEDLFGRARIGQMAAKVQSGWQWLQSASEMWEARADAAQMVAFAAMMRVATEEICNATLEMAERSVGARGLMRPGAIERISRDLTMYLKQPHLDEIPVRVGKFALESNAPAHELWASDGSSSPQIATGRKGCGG